MHARILRFLFALPVAFVATAGLYYFWFSGFMNQKCDGCGVEPTQVGEAPKSWRTWVEEFWSIYIEDFMPPTPADPSNSYTRRDKASPTAPEPVECGEDCDPAQIKIAEDALQLTPAALGVADKYAPPYPKVCRAKGVSGAVTVDYDITPEGAVANARIVSSPDRCFNAEVLREISKYHYQPQTDETGRAIWRRGVRQTFVFELAG